MKKFTLQLAVYSWVFLGSLGAAFGSDYHSPRTAALGGAGHAGPTLNDAIYLNPSYGALLPSYSLAIGYLWYTGDLLHGRGLNVSIQDGRSELFQAGVGYTQREDANTVHIGAAKSLNEKLGTGLGAKFFFLKGDSRTAVREATFSTTFVPVQWMQLAVIVDNLFQTASSREHGLYREIILGTKVNVQNLVLIYFDPHFTPSLDRTYGHELGLEFGVATDFFVRMGQFHNSLVPSQQGARGRGYGLGFGWIGPRMSLDYALSRPITPEASTVHNMSMTVYF